VRFRFVVAVDLAGEAVRCIGDSPVGEPDLRRLFGVGFIILSTVSL
jgi:hypothetical protein